MHDYNNCFEINETKHICMIEIIFTKEEQFLGQIIFFDKDGTLYKLGSDGNATGRKETFQIAENERLIGCELDHGNNYVMGITFIKWTI